MKLSYSFGARPIILNVPLQTMQQREITGTFHKKKNTGFRKSNIFPVYKAVIIKWCPISRNNLRHTF
jgi:hypothetical protein